MQMIRTFNAVGQGGFYTECFEDGCNVVYDCGTSSDMRCLKREIDSQFEQDERIEAVFISHLHADHCNGLDYLSDRCSIKKIFLPFLCSTDKILTLLEVGIHEGCESFLWKLIEDAGQAFAEKGKETEVIYVLPENDSDEDNEVLNPSLNTIESGTQITLEYQDSWIFVPFHFKEYSLTAQLLEALKEAGISLPKSGEEIKRLLEDASMRDRLKKIYDTKVEGNHNIHSMVLYSGPLNTTEDSDTWAYRWAVERENPTVCPYIPYEEVEAGCLYTGDYQAKETHKWKALWQFAKPYLHRIGCCQLPHHGAAGSYHKGFKDLCEEFVISCGYRNGYHHPDSRVIRDLLFENKIISIATEAGGGRVTYIIDGFNRW